MKYLWEEGDTMFFPWSIQSHQLPLFAEVLKAYCTSTCWVSGSAALPNRERALVFATRCQSRCKTMVRICLVQQTEYEQLHRVSRKLVLLQGRECVLSVCLPPGLTGPLLPSSAVRSSMDKYTNGFRWTFEDIVGMKRVFEWILEIRDHSLRGRLCKM